MDAKGAVVGIFELFQRRRKTALASKSPQENDVPVQPDEISKYFRHILQRREREEIDFAESNFLKIPKEQLESPELDSESTRLLYRLSGHGEEKCRNAGPPEPIDIVISVATLQETTGSAKGLSLVAAKLSFDGKLAFELNPGVNPWIPSERLRALSTIDNPVMVGDLSRFGEYIRGEFYSRFTSLETPVKEISLAEDMFEYVASVNLEDFTAWAKSSEYNVDVDHLYVRPWKRVMATGELQKLYSFLIGNSDSSLYQRMSQGWEGPKTHSDELSKPSIRLEAALRVRGNMSNGFPLTPSQRRAVHATVLSNSGEVTAVSGPPGTGKTTLLQAVVANLITEHALDGAAAPIIVGTSTNNQAVTNIIESFSAVANANFGLLDHRWLPATSSGSESLQGLAVYCPSKAKLKRASATYLVEQTTKDQTFEKYSKPEYLGAARAYFMQRVHEFFPEASNVFQACRRLHASLKEIDQIRIDLLTTIAECSKEPPEAKLRSHVEKLKAMRFFQHVQGIDQLALCVSLDELDEKLDTTVRYVEFWLAVHYFEARWLELGEDDSFLPEEDRWKNTRYVLNQYWTQAPLLTPCFVMTAYQVPRYFKVFTPENSPDSYSLGRIDLLIVDEAGQVDSSVGLANFSLAKRALVVGDEKQLPPVWSLDAESDRAVANGFEISEVRWREQLSPRGLTGSHPSSLMRVASTASKYTCGKPEKPSHGLLLTEHFRCHPTIIGFCNELLYDGLLEPKRSANDSKLSELSEPFVFHEVPGSADTREGSSRKNLVEAIAIAHWILNNFETYLEMYNAQDLGTSKEQPDNKLIAVVTPFKAQAELIEKVLRSEARRSGEEVFAQQIPEKITVGTAHTLQGAERPIIVFSSTYGENSPQASFIDNKLELINVAVSRAKDMFVVFGAKNRWNNGKVFETMSRYATRWKEAETRVQQPNNQLVENLEAQEQSEETPATEFATPLAISQLLHQWKSAGVLRLEDQAVTAAAFNKRLCVAGILSGTPGRWRVTAIGKQIGVLAIPRVNKDGAPYLAIQYTEQAQAILESMYKQGDL